MKYRGRHIGDDERRWRDSGWVATVTGLVVAVVFVAVVIATLR